MTRVSDYEVIYDRGQIKARTSALHDFKMSAFKEKLDPFKFEMDLTTVQRFRRSIMEFRNDALPSMSFAIECGPERGSGECFSDEVAGVTPFYCVGEVEFKNLTEFYSK